MRIECLRYFLVTANCKSMTLSSKILHISQQCISREIKQLEMELGAQLFIRSKTGVSLTDEGNMIYESVAQILKQIESLTKIFENNEPSTYNIGSYIGFKIHLESIVRIFESTHPFVSLIEYYYSTEALITELQQCNLDLILWQSEKESLTQITDSFNNYEHIILIEEPIQILLNASAVDSDMKCFYLNTLKKYPICFYCTSMQEVPLYEKISQRYGPLNIIYRGNNMERSWNIFAKKNAVALMTKSICHLFPDSIPTKLIPLDEYIPVCTVLSIKKNLLEMPNIRNLIDIFQNLFSQFI